MLRYIASRISIIIAAAEFALPTVSHLAAQESAKAFFKVDIDVQKLLANKALGKMAAQVPMREIAPELDASGLSLSDFKRITLAGTSSVADFAVFMMEQNAQYSEKMDELGFFQNVTTITMMQRKKKSGGPNWKNFNKSNLKKFRNNALNFSFNLNSVQQKLLNLFWPAASHPTCPRKHLTAKQSNELRRARCLVYTMTVTQG